MGPFYGRSGKGDKEGNGCRLLESLILDAETPYDYLLSYPSETEREKERNGCRLLESLILILNNDETALVRVLRDQTKNGVNKGAIADTYIRI